MHIFSVGDDILSVLFAQLDAQTATLMSVVCRRFQHIVGCTVPRILRRQANAAVQHWGPLCVAIQRRILSAEGLRFAYRGLGCYLGCVPPTSEMPTECWIWLLYCVCCWVNSERQSEPCLAYHADGGGYTVSSDLQAVFSEVTLRRMAACRTHMRLDGYGCAVDDAGGYLDPTAVFVCLTHPDGVTVAAADIHSQHRSVPAYTSTSFEHYQQLYGRRGCAIRSGLALVGVHIPISLAWSILWRYWGVIERWDLVGALRQDPWVPLDRNDYPWLDYYLAFVCANPVLLQRRVVPPWQCNEEFCLELLPIMQSLARLKEGDFRFALAHGVLMLQDEYVYFSGAGLVHRNGNVWFGHGWLWLVCTEHGRWAVGNNLVDCGPDGVPRWVATHRDISQSICQMIYETLPAIGCP